MPLWDGATGMSRFALSMVLFLGPISGAHFKFGRPARRCDGVRHSMARSRNVSTFARAIVQLSRISFFRHGSDAQVIEKCAHEFFFQRAIVLRPESLV
jgi:hypothetical protein